MTSTITLPLTKMEGLGNDFIVIDDLGAQPATAGTLPAPFAQKICDRRLGVGADQILWLKKPHDKTCHARMEILNSDGSSAEMCGNGIRAVALYMNQHVRELGQILEYRIETLAGIKIVKLQGDLVHSPQVLVDMGQAVLGGGFPSEGEGIEVQLDQENSRLHFYEVNVGNPHAVFFVDDVDKYPVEKLGPWIEKHSRFPQRTNVEFVEIKNSNTIQVRVWERGAGITLACGTGACASAVASLALGKVQSPVHVQLPGGTLKISWNGASSQVMMEGPATEVFQGVYSFKNR